MAHRISFFKRIVATLVSAALVAPAGYAQNEDEANNGNFDTMTAIVGGGADGGYGRLSYAEMSLGEFSTMARAEPSPDMVTIAIPAGLPDEEIALMADELKATVADTATIRFQEYDWEALQYVVDQTGVYVDTLEQDGNITAEEAAPIREDLAQMNKQLADAKKGIREHLAQATRPAVSWLKRQAGRLGDLKAYVGRLTSSPEFSTKSRMATAKFLTGSEALVWGYFFGSALFDRPLSALVVLLSGALLSRYNYLIGLHIYAVSGAVARFNYRGIARQVGSAIVHLPSLVGRALVRNRPPLGEKTAKAAGGEVKSVLAKAREWYGRFTAWQDRMTAAAGRVVERATEGTEKQNIGIGFLKAFAVLFPMALGVGLAKRYVTGIADPSSPSVTLDYFYSLIQLSLAYKAVQTLSLTAARALQNRGRISKADPELVFIGESFLIWLSSWMLNLQISIKPVLGLLGAMYGRYWVKFGWMHLEPTARYAWNKFAPVRSGAQALLRKVSFNFVNAGEPLDRHPELLPISYATAAMTPASANDMLAGLAEAGPEADTLEPDAPWRTKLEAEWRSIFYAGRGCGQTYTEYAIP